MDHVKKYDFATFLKQLKQKMSSDYTFQSPPSLFSGLYQLCDIVDDVIKNILKSAIINEVCTKETGLVILIFLF